LRKKIILILIYKTSGFESNSKSIATFESGRRLWGPNSLLVAIFRKIPNAQWASLKEGPDIISC